MERRAVLWLDLALKATLVALLLFAVARPDLPQFHGKAMAARALLYPISALIVPVVWWLRGRRPPYPYALDILLVLPFLIDVAGNAANLSTPSTGGTTRTTSSTGRSSWPPSGSSCCGCASAAGRRSAWRSGSAP
jgi:hypothetical protein